MKRILLLLLILFTNQIFAQKNLDEKIDEGIALYQNGKEKEVLKVWKKIEARQTRHHQHME